MLRSKEDLATYLTATSTRGRRPSLVVGSPPGWTPDTDVTLEAEYELIDSDIKENHNTTLSIMRQRTAKVYAVLKKHEDPRDALEDVDVCHLEGFSTYQPPEKDASTTAADVWAAGAIVRYLAVGSAPVERYAGNFETSPLPKGAEQFFNFGEVDLSISNIERALDGNKWLGDRAQPYTKEMDLQLGRALTERNKRATAAEQVRDVTELVRRHVRDAGRLPRWAASI